MPEDVSTRISALRAGSSWRAPEAFAIGLATFSGTKVLDTWYPVVNRTENEGFVALAAEIAGIGSDAGTVRLTGEELGRLSEALPPPAPPPPPAAPRAPPSPPPTTPPPPPPPHPHVLFRRLHLLSLRRLRPN